MKDINWREFGPGEVEAAKGLFFKYGPGNSNMIVQEMRELGWEQFKVGDLGGKTGRYAGLVKALGWEEEWQKDHRPEPVADDKTAEAEAEYEAQQAVPSRIETADFPAWLAAGNENWTWTWKYQKYIYKHLDKMTRGRLQRLMIFLPPRHGKSELVTIRYAAWRLACDPGFRIIIGSYNQRLANRFSRRIRSIYLGGPRVDRGEYAEERDLVLNTMDEWETPEGGGVKAVGAGAGVTGFGANLIIIDDPIKNRAEAESKNNRERIWEWFTDDLMTRLEPKGSVILIQTRWHEDDLAGRLLKARQETGDGSLEREGQSPWSVICLPALAEENLTAETQRRGEENLATDEHRSTQMEDDEVGGKLREENLATDEHGSTQMEDDEVEDKLNKTSRRLRVSAVKNDTDAIGRKPGEALCPKRFDREALLRKKAEMGSYSFAALYQQSPVPNEGALFKREWFSRIVPYAPDGLHWYRGYDLAVSTKTSADYTASFRCAFDKRTGDLYIADGFRGRLEFPDQRKYITARIREESDTEHGIEEALHGQAFVQELWRDEKLSQSAFRGVRVRSDKFTRALSWANRAESGKVVLVRGPWIEAFLDEVTHFPNSAHDDQVDAVSLAVSMIETRKMMVYAF